MIKVEGQFIREPELEFGGGHRHLDIRFGLREFGPLDSGEGGPTEVRLGVVGTTDTVNGLKTWLSKIAEGAEAKKSRLPNLYVPFPGYGKGSNLAAPIIVASEQKIGKRKIAGLFKEKDNDKAVRQAVDLFLDEIAHVSENHGVDVVVCAPPKEIWDLMDRGAGDNTDDEEEGGGASGVDFHDALKAKALGLRCPLQFVWPHTYTGKAVERPRRQGRGGSVKRDIQDEASRAWNLYTALYYKANGVPWRLVRDSSDYSSCFVGVSFYVDLDGSTVQTSVAQVFNERGEGIILNGGPAKKSKEGDRQIHLDKQGAKTLLARSLKSFRAEHKRTPARVVLHKVSPFNEDEEEGFWEACDDENIEILELVHVRERFGTKLFRPEYHAPLRGTFLSLDPHYNILYTRGSIEFYQTYPGLYVPTALGFDVHGDGDPLSLAQEILSLTKMSWNNTQIDNLKPVTIKAARKVGALLKYADLGSSKEARPVSYRYFM